VNSYPFIEAEKAEQDGNVAMACRLLEVSRAAYYEWSTKVPSARELSDGELAERIKQIHNKSGGRYGAPRITDELRGDGVCVGKKRIARLMALNGLVGRCKRRFKKTTIADPNAETKAIDLIRRNFGVGVREIDTAWCGDITYVRTWEGWLYLATVIDLESRRVVGFAMADHMRADLVTDALQMAINLRRPAPGLIFHSDRGSQYTSGAFRHLLEQNGIVQSLSRPGQCWDNAVAESWFATLKEELIYCHPWPARAMAQRAIFEFIEVFYNRERRHSSLGSISPVEYERRKTGQALTRTQAA
jgi:transposase InsO family protein